MPNEMKKRIVCCTQYGQEIQRKELLAILHWESDMPDTLDYETLSQRLEKRTSAYDVNYDGMFAFTGVTYNLLKSDDTEKMHKRIQEIICKFIIEATIKTQGTRSVR